MMVLSTIVRGVCLTALAICLSNAQAAPDSYTFSLSPLGGSVHGMAGDTVGWGYTISNNSTKYLVTTAINADLFAQGTPHAIFDFPVVAPGVTVFENFEVGQSGLYELTWDETAQVGWHNTGTFVLSAEYYTADPLAGGVFLSRADDAFSAYSATVSSVSTVPEPATVVLTCAGLLIVGWRARHATHGCRSIGRTA